MNQTEYRLYLLTPEWERRRQAALEHAQHRCQTCNSPEDLHVHHRTYERLGNEHPRDLTVLCEPCHAIFHDKPSRTQAARDLAHLAQIDRDAAADQLARLAKVPAT